jgi:hypothetical protein
MIFGIKSKKDKKIDELQAEIERLKSTLVHPPKVFSKSYDIKKLKAVFCVPFEEVDYIPDGYVQDALVHQLASNLEEIITVSEDTDYDNCKKVYCATLNVCIRRDK